MPTDDLISRITDLSDDRGDVGGADGGEALAPELGKVIGVLGYEDADELAAKAGSLSSNAISCVRRKH
jgi:hypothetical protein